MGRMAMSSFPVLIAEIADKEPSLLVFVGGAVICIAVALLIVRFKWAVLIALPLATIFAAFCAAYIFEEVGDPQVGPAIIHELGYTYVALVYVCGITPITVALPLFFRRLGMARTGWIGTGIAIFATPVLAFGSANTADFIHYRAAVRRATGLSPAQIAALAERCASISKHERFENGGWPAEFAPLHPLTVSIGPGLSYASLYELGDIYFEFRVETTPHDQRIYFFTNSDGPQKTTLVWDKNPEFTRRANPTGRIVTLSGYGLNYGQDWIVLPDRVLVTERPGTAGSEDSVVSVPLDANSAASIKRLVADLHRRLGGKMYEGGGYDGLGMAVHFSPSGAPALDDVAVHCAWVDEISPLVDAISKVTTEAPPAELRRRIISLREDAPPGSPGPMIRTIAEARVEWAGRPRLPWWCVWRNLRSIAAPATPGTDTNVPDAMKYVRD